jgi:transposase-like protein
MIRSKDHKFSLRLAMVMHAKKHGVRPTARAFGTTPNTVRRWVKRFLEGGRGALKDLSRAPKSCPHKASPEKEKMIIKARKQTPCFGPRRLKDLFGLQPSTGVIARVLRQNNLTRKRKKKHQKKNDLRAVKSRYMPCERLQADTKPLYDIPVFWPQMRAHHLPTHQYTVRDVKSGALWLDYAADELSATYATMAAERLLDHLAQCGMDLKQTILSTDNGSEYGGQDRTLRERGFHYKIQLKRVTHRFLPPATPNAHAEVESSHASIEQELFDLETFASRADFFQKVRIYQRWWNFARPNYSKHGKTPAQILQHEGVDPRILLLDPLDLDNLLRYRDGPHQVVSHLPAFPDWGDWRRGRGHKRVRKARNDGFC